MSSKNQFQKNYFYFIYWCFKVGENDVRGKVNWTGTSYYNGVRGFTPVLLRLSEKLSISEWLKDFRKILLKEKSQRLLLVKCYDIKKVKSLSRCTILSYGILLVANQQQQKINFTDRPTNNIFF